MCTHDSFYCSIFDFYSARACARDNRSVYGLTLTLIYTLFRVLVGINTVLTPADLRLVPPLYNAVSAALHRRILRNFMKERSQEFFEFASDTCLGRTFQSCPAY